MTECDKKHSITFRITFSGRNVTENVQITFQSFYSGLHQVKGRVIGKGDSIEDNNHVILTDGDNPFGLSLIHK